MRFLSMEAQAGDASQKKEHCRIVAFDRNPVATSVASIFLLQI
jgi:hypothetical protein